MAAQNTDATGELKTTAEAVARRATEEVLALSHSIHAEPETAFEEIETSRKATDVLRRHGFEVETGVADMQTAFVASYGSGDLVIGVCAELDALPGVGHACGHNIIAASGVLAGLALASVADRAGLTVKVFGTPAEEFGGGKIFMLRAGVFDGVHAAMMVHPGDQEHDTHFTRSVVDLEVRYTGRPAHSAMAPYEGINAGDAATIAQVSIGLLRQHLRPGELVHGIVTEAGHAPNVVPHSSSLLYDARADTIADLEGPGGVKERLIRCFEAGAVATGCYVEIKDDWPAFSEFRNDEPMVAAYRRNAEALGRTFSDVPAEQRQRQAGSTDMANVSLEIPAIHPSIFVDGQGSTPHQPEFAQYCVGPDADRAVTDGGIALCWTAIDMATDADQRERLMAPRKAEA